MSLRLFEMPQRSEPKAMEEFLLFKARLMAMGLSTDDATVAACILATEQLSICDPYTPEEREVCDRVWQVWEQWSTSHV